MDFPGRKQRCVRSGKNPQNSQQMFHKAKIKRAETQSLCRRSPQVRISPPVRCESPKKPKKKNQRLQLRLNPQLPCRTTAHAVNQTSPPRVNAHNLQVKCPLTCGTTSGVIDVEEPNQVSSTLTPAAMLSRTNPSSSKPPATPRLSLSLALFLPPTVQAAAHCKKCASFQ